MAAWPPSVGSVWDGPSGLAREVLHVDLQHVKVRSSWPLRLGGCGAHVWRLRRELWEAWDARERKQ